MLLADLEQKSDSRGGSLDLTYGDDIKGIMYL